MDTGRDQYREMISVPRATRFPVDLKPPPGFRPGDPATWPKVVGKLEYVGGRLIYMTPSGDIQQDVTGSVAGLLDRWLDEHPEYTFGTNEAGMMLGGEVRAADAAVWARKDLGPYSGGYRRVPPILAVEVAGAQDEETALLDKAAWYLEHGAKTVWLVLPGSREVLVLRPGTEPKTEVKRHGEHERLPPDAALPGLTPKVSRFFKRLE